MERILMTFREFRSFVVVLVQLAWRINKTLTRTMTQRFQTKARGLREVGLEAMRNAKTKKERMALARYYNDEALEKCLTLMSNPEVVCVLEKISGGDRH